MVIAMTPQDGLSRGAIQSGVAAGAAHHIGALQTNCELELALQSLRLQRTTGEAYATGDIAALRAPKVCGHGVTRRTSRVGRTDHLASSRHVKGWWSNKGVCLPCVRPAEAAST